MYKYSPPKYDDLFDICSEINKKDNNNKNFDCCTISFRQLKKERQQMPLCKKLVLWVSHSDNESAPYNDVLKIQSFVNSCDNRVFSFSTTVKIVVTGYLNRYNACESVDIFKTTSNEQKKKAIEKGYERQNTWLDINSKNFKNFNCEITDWKDCISDIGSYRECYDLVARLLFSNNKNDLWFKEAFEKTAKKYVDDHFGTIEQLDEKTYNARFCNSMLLLVEETSWVLKKYLYDDCDHIVYFGEKSDAISALFKAFRIPDNFWLTPTFKCLKYSSKTEFLIDYKDKENKSVGYSLPTSNPDIFNKISLGKNGGDDKNIEKEKQTKLKVQNTKNGNEKNQSLFNNNLNYFLNENNINDNKKLIDLKTNLTNSNKLEKVGIN